MNSWPGGERRAMDQAEHEIWNASHYPGTLQLCSRCEEPTGRCEEDTIEGRDGLPLCPGCWETEMKAGPFTILVGGAFHGATVEVAGPNVSFMFGETQVSRVASATRVIESHERILGDGPASCWSSEQVYSLVYLTAKPLGLPGGEQFSLPAYVWSGLDFSRVPEFMRDNMVAVQCGADSCRARVIAETMRLPSRGFVSDPADSGPRFSFHNSAVSWFDVKHGWHSGDGGTYYGDDLVELATILSAQKYRGAEFAGLARSVVRTMERFPHSRAAEALTRCADSVLETIEKMRLLAGATRWAEAAFVATAAAWHLRRLFWSEEPGRFLLGYGGSDET